MSAPATPRVLVRRGVDGLLVGWLAVGVWLAVFVGGRLGIGSDLPGLDAVYWGGIVVGAAHFGLSYHLAYRRGTAALRERPVVLVTAPLLLVGILTVTTVAALAGGHAVTDEVTRALITTVYLLTTWHYVKQVYGVGRIGAAYAGVTLGTWDVRVLRYGLYPLWFVGAAQVLTVDRSLSLAGFSYGYGLLPDSAVSALQWIAVLSAAPLALVLGRIVSRAGRLPSLLVAPYVAAFLWLALPTDPLLLVLLLAPFHALQYLAIGHRAEVSLARDETGDGSSGPGVTWWLNIFVGAACGGLLLSRWAPAYLDTQLSGGGPRLFAAAFFVFLNLHHYLIDAAIWRSKGELIKALGRKQGTGLVVSDGLSRRPDPAPQGAVR